MEHKIVMLKYLEPKLSFRKESSDGKWKLSEL